MKRGPQHVVPGHEWGKLQQEQSERTPAKDRSEQACHGLAEE
jgi:hypothetical protein